MTIHVSAAELQARIAELLDVVRSGEEVVVEDAGQPRVRLAPAEDDGERKGREAIAQRRARAIGMFEKEFEGYDLSLEALKAHRGDPEERYRRKFADPA